GFSIKALCLLQFFPARRSSDLFLNAHLVSSGCGAGDRKQRTTATKDPYDVLTRARVTRAQDECVESSAVQQTPHLRPTKLDTVSMLDCALGDATSATQQTIRRAVAPASRA